MAKETRYAWLAAGLVLIIGGTVTMLILENSLFWLTIILGMICLMVAALGKHFPSALSDRRKMKFGKHF